MSRKITIIKENGLYKKCGHCMNECQDKGHVFLLEVD